MFCQRLFLSRVLCLFRQVWPPMTPVFSTSRLYHGLSWYARVYTTRDYAITYLFHDCRARANTGLQTVEWVMGRYLTPDMC